MLSTDYVCRILSKLEVYQRVFQKYANIKFDQNPSSGSWAVPYERTDEQADKHDETNIRLRNFANPFKKQPHGILRDGTAASFLL